MQRKLVKSAVVIAIEALIAMSTLPQLAIVAFVVAGALYLLWTWDGLPDWVERHQAEDRLTTLTGIQPPPVGAPVMEPPARAVKPDGSWGTRFRHLHPVLRQRRARSKRQ